MNASSPDAECKSVDTSHLYPVILCGGVGTRLWPLSRAAYPKQLLALTSDKTLLQETATRACTTLGLRNPIVICGKEQRFMVAEQLEEENITPDAILCEPYGRSTGPALAIAAMFLRGHDPEAVMLALPSDHHIGDTRSFRTVVETAAIAARRGHLLCFGISPSRAETGYGYIQKGAALNDTKGAFKIQRFIEKPDLTTANQFLAHGDYYWNSGMFVLPASAYMEEFAEYRQDAAKACEIALTKSRKDRNCIHLDEEGFASAPSISVDYAIMERTRRAAMVPADILWNDIGSWHSLKESAHEDEAGNVIQGDVIAEDVRNSYIRADKRLVAALGIEDMIIVDTDDALLVSRLDRAPEVGKIVQKLKKRGRTETEFHRRVLRPWGYYESVHNGEQHQVKHIVVKPGAQLSLQMHHHRSEHWIIVGGTGSITCDDEIKLLSINEVIYIPLGAKHRLENPGKLPLHLIEVQIGDYLGEDDIVRFDDIYGRA